MFNAIKISESLGITIFTWFAGYIRQVTDGFTGVSLMLCICAITSMVLTYLLIEQTKAVGYQKFNLSSIVEGFFYAKSFVFEKMYRFSSPELKDNKENQIK